MKDLGAFEQATTGPGIGPYDTQPTLDGGVTFGDGGGGGDGGVTGGDGGGGGDGGTTGGGSSGCGCDVAGSSGSVGWIGLLALLAPCRRRTRRGS